MDLTASAPSRRSDGGAWYVLAVMWLVYVFHGMDRSILLVLLDAIAREFTLSDSQVGAVAGLAYALPFALAGIPMGLLIDRVDRVRLLAALLALWSLLTIASGLARSYAMLLLARAGVGASEAGAPPAMLSILGDRFDDRRRPLAISIYYTAPSVGLILGSILAGYLAQTHGWRAALLVTGTPGLLLALLMIFVLRDPPRGAFGTVAIEKPVGIARALGMVLGDPPLRRLIVALVLGGVAITSTAAWTPIFLQRIHGVSQAAAGSLTALSLGIPGALGTVIGGTIASGVAKGDPIRLRRLCASALIAASPALLLAPLVTALPAVLILLGLWSLLAAAYVAPAWSLCVLTVPPHIRGTILATTLVLANLIGSGVGPWLVGALSDLLAAAGDRAHLQHAMAMLALSALVTAALFLVGRAAQITGRKKL